MKKNIDKLEKIFLKRELALYMKKLGFAKIKLIGQMRGYTNVKHVSFRDNSEFVQSGKDEMRGQGDSIYSVQLENKELYLKYMQQVLINKEQELISLQVNFLELRRQEEAEQFKKRVTVPMSLEEESEILTLKIENLKDFAKKHINKGITPAFNQDYEQFIRDLQAIEQNCKKSNQKAKEEVKSQYQNLMNERQAVSAKLSKLSQLESYQKYLTQLQHLLEHKQYQIIEKEKASRLNTGFYETVSLDHRGSNPQNRYNTFEREELPKFVKNNDDQSSRKRNKIFEQKIFQTNQVFGEQKHKQSSKIMQQNSTNDNHQTKNSNSDERLFMVQESEVRCDSVGIQTQFETMDHAVERLDKQKKYIKFIRLWLKFSDRFTKTNNLQHRKVMNLYLWRINAIFDENLYQKIEENMNWPAKIDNLGQIPAIPYSQLALKKKRYAQLFFDFQRKKFQKRKILTLLKSITKNKSRKERLALVLMFRKYLQNVHYLSYTSQANFPVDLALKEKTNKNSAQASKSKTLNNSRGAESRIYTLSSSNIMNQNKILFNEQYSRKSKINTKDSNKNLVHGSNHSLVGSKMKSAGKDSIDLQRLRQYIKNQQQTEAKLAVECAKIQASYKILTTIAPIIGKRMNVFVINLVRGVEIERLRVLQKNINSCEFKRELFMAKARIALTNNANKISHLQQIISYTYGDK